MSSSKDNPKDDVGRDQNPTLSPSASSSTSSTLYSEEVQQLADKIETSFKLLAAILEEAVELDHYLRTHKVVKNSSQFKYVDEMLTQCLLRLDQVETHGVQEVRQYRREVAVKVNGIASVLDLIRDST